MTPGTVWRRMRGNVWTPLVLVALVLPTTIVASAEDAATTVRVALPRAGDVVEYLGREHDVGMGPYPYDYEYDYSHRTRVNATREVPDQMTRPRPAVEFEEATFLVPSGQPASAWRRFIALDTRETLRNDLSFRGVAGVTSRYEANLSAYGPDFVYDYFARDTFAYGVAQVQGRALRLGDDLSAPYQRAAEAHVAAVARAMGVEADVEVVARVAQRGVIDGREVLSLETVERQTWTVEGMRLDAWLNGTNWYADGDAYPLRSDWDVYMAWPIEEGLKVEKWTGVSALRRVERGGEEIVWGDAPVDAPRVHPAAEWGAGAFRVPVKGEGSRISYGIEDAAASVVADPSLVRFHTWRLQNPGAIPIGALFGRSLPTNPGPWIPVEGAEKWLLHFAAPGGETAYRVASTRLADGRVVNTEFPQTGIVPLAPDLRFTLDDLPERMVTLAFVDRAWREVDPDAHALGVDDVAWGYAELLGGQVPTSPRDATQGLGSYAEVTPAHLLSTVKLGLMRRAPTDAVAFLPTARDFTALNVRVDLERGALLEGRRLVLRPDLDGGVPSSVGAIPYVLLPAGGAPPAGGWGPVELAAATASSVIGLALLVYFLPIVKQGLAVLYTRLTRATVADHAVRDALLRRIRETPAISPPELHRDVGGGWSTVVYHLRVLEREGFVRSVLDGRHRRYFANDVDRRDAPALMALRNDRTRAVYELLRARPGIERPEVARAIGVSLPGTLFHLRRLEQAGLIRRERRGRAFVYEPAPMAGAAASA